MDTVHPEDSTCILPSARELLLHVDDHPASKSSSSPSISGTSEEPNSTDKMQIDEPFESSNSREPLPHNDQGYYLFIYFIFLFFQGKKKKKLFNVVMEIFYFYFYYYYFIKLNLLFI